MYNGNPFTRKYDFYIEMVSSYSLQQAQSKMFRDDPFETQAEPVHWIFLLALICQPADITNCRLKPGQNPKRGCRKKKKHFESGHSKFKITSATSIVFKWLPVKQCLHLQPWVHYIWTLFPLYTLLLPSMYILILASYHKQPLATGTML